MTKITDTARPTPPLGEAGSDPIEDRLRETVRATIEALFDEELAAYLGRIRYGRGGGARKGYRHGRRGRELVGTFGAETVSVPRARIEGEDGRTTEWRSQGAAALPAADQAGRSADPGHHERACHPDEDPVLHPQSLLLLAYLAIGLILLPSRPAPAKSPS